MKRFLWAVMFVFLCLAGCGKKEMGGVRVVSAVDVICDRGYQIQRRHFTQPEKMEMVLDYLRLQPDLGPVEKDPEKYAGQRIRIDVTLSDGTHRVYYQQGDRFLSRQLHPWQHIDPVRAAEFSENLLRMSTDL